MNNLFAQAELITAEPSESFISMESSLMAGEQILNMRCSHYNPREWNGTTPESDDPFQFASSTCSFPFISASTTMGFTNGEIINSIFLFLIFIILLFDKVADWLKLK